MKSDIYVSISYSHFLGLVFLLTSQTYIEDESPNFVLSQIDSIVIVLWYSSFMLPFLTIGVYFYSTFSQNFNSASNF